MHRHARHIHRAHNPDEFEIDTAPSPEEAEANDRLVKSKAAWKAAHELGWAIQQEILFIKHKHGGSAQKNLELVARLKQLFVLTDAAEDAANVLYEEAAAAVKKFRAKKTVPSREGQQSALIRRGRSENPRSSSPRGALKTEAKLLSILQQTRPIKQKVHTSKGSYYDIDFRASLARGLKNCEDALGRPLTEAEIARVDRFYRLDNNF